MTDRDRLIELLVNFNPYKDPIIQMGERIVIEKISDYLLANGVIAPPDKMGNIICEIITDIIKQKAKYGSDLSSLEKQIPKKPKVLKVHDISNYEYGECQCGEHIMDDEKYCSNCGQKIDWGDTKEKTYLNGTYSRGLK